jgi:hypothetical protein
MNFPEQFHEWLQSSFRVAVPDQVVAFSFNIFEPALADGFRFGVELIGAASFDAGDPNWACDEVWAAEQRGISIPTSFSGLGWEDCALKVKALLLSELELHSDVSSALKSREAVCLGFVDGALEIVWSPMP